MMAHRSDSGAAVVSSSAEPAEPPRPDPGDGDVLRDAFAWTDAHTRTLSAAAGTRRAMFWERIVWFLVALIIGMWLVFLLMGCVAIAGEPDVPQAVTPVPVPVPVVPIPGPQIPQFCDTHLKVVTNLEQRWAEHPRAIGLDLAGRLVELFVAKDGATWTIAVTTPGGPTCMVAVGEHWEFLPEPTPEGPRA